MRHPPLTLQKVHNIFKRQWLAGTGVNFDSVKEKTVIDGAHIIKYWTICARVGGPNEDNPIRAEVDVENAMFQLSRNRDEYAKKVSLALIMSVIGAKQNITS